jgi:hypothetical protein
MRRIVYYCFLILVVSGCEMFSSKTGQQITICSLVTDDESSYRVSSTLVEYDDILGYDKDKHTFKLEADAWQSIDNILQSMSLNPNLVLGVVIDDEIIYSTVYIPLYTSASYCNTLTYIPWQPNRLEINLGYACPVGSFTGSDLRNDSRIISIFERDDKLISISNFK